MMNFFGNMYNLVLFAIGVIGTVAGIVSIIKKTPMRLSIYFKGIDRFNNDFISQISHFKIQKEFIQLDTTKDYVILNLFIKNTGNSDLSKTDFTNDIEICIPSYVKIIGTNTQDSPSHFKSNIRFQDGMVTVSFALLKRKEIIKLAILCEVEKIKELWKLENKLRKDFDGSYRAANLK